MFQRLDNFGGGGLNADLFESGLSAQQWSVIENADIAGGDLESAGADAVRGTPPPIRVRYQYLYLSGDRSWDVVSDGEEVWAAIAGEDWQQLAKGWGGGIVTFDVFRGCLLVNSRTDGLHFWCTVYGNAQEDNWDSEVTLPWDDSCEERNWDWTPLVERDAWGSAITDGAWQDDSLQWDEYPAGQEPLQRAPGWCDGWTALQVVAYKDQLVAIGVNAPSIYGDAAEPFLVLWSSLAPAGSFPNAWNPQVGNFAGYVLVQDTPGALAAALLLRDDLILYKTDSIWRLSATGDPGLPMRLERVMTCRGVETPYGVTACGEEHWLVNDRGLGRFNGNSFDFLDFARVKAYLRENILQALFNYRLIAFYGQRQEVWIGFSPNNEDEYLQGILKYNILHNAFTIHTFPDDYLQTFACGRQTTIDVLTDTWENGETLTWDEEEKILWRGQGPLNTTEVAVLATSEGLAQYWHYTKPTYRDGSPKAARLERYGLRFVPNRQSWITALYPEAAYDEITVRAGRSWTPGQQLAETVKWEPPRTFVPGLGRKIPYAFQCDTLALRVDSTKQWRLHAVGIEYSEGAER